MKSVCSVSHISHGVVLTGGYLHEKCVFESVCNKLEQSGTKVYRHSFRTQRFFKGLSQFKMVWQGMVQANADINFVSNWMALYAWVRNFFSRRLLVITWHHHDDADVKTRMTRLYMRILFTLLSYTRSKRVAILVVSEFWEHYFSSRVSSSVDVLYFPNLFDTDYYRRFQQPKRERQIYLGQLAFKTDQHIFELAHLLTQKGYYCFFSTLDESNVGEFDDYSVIFFQDHSDYLTQVARSEYSVAYTKLNEGWNRVAHESILVGTQVIGVPRGGLGDLLRQSNSISATSVADIMQSIVSRKTSSVPPDFFERYDLANKDRYAERVITFRNTR